MSPERGVGQRPECSALPCTALSTDRHLRTISTRTSREEASMASDSAVIQRFTEEVFLKGNLDVIDELISDDYVDHDPPPEMPPTKEGVRVLAQMIASAFSN